MHLLDSKTEPGSMPVLSERQSWDFRIEISR